MLNGISPLLIFNFKKLLPQANVSGIPLLNKLTDTIPLAPIPIYLDERYGLVPPGAGEILPTFGSGIVITSHGKNIDVNTKADTNVEGKTPDATQDGLNSVVTINMLANKGSISLSVLIALCDLVFPKVTSQEYSISYINGAFSVFGGLLEGFSAQESDTDNLLRLTLQLSNAKAGTTETSTASTTEPIQKYDGIDISTATGAVS
jgi:hypothetical protein